MFFTEDCVLCFPFGGRLTKGDDLVFQSVNSNTDLTSHYYSEAGNQEFCGKHE